jgi:RNA polymerase sigma factor (sigma-70 family)
MDRPNNALVASARAGDRAALEQLVAQARDLVYNLAVRMLGNKAEAEDASQEILIRIVTGLATFREESSFKTWVYRVASNHLLTMKKAGAYSFETLTEYLEQGTASDVAPLENQVLVTEAKLTCTSTMLTCLDRDHRLAYVLGEILELSSEEGAEALEISSDAFRKRLSRARDRMNEYMSKQCGLVNAARPCRCSKQAACAAKAGRLSLETAQWVTHPAHEGAPAQQLAELDELQRVAAIFKGHPNYASPESLVAGLKQLLSRP